MSCVTGSVAIAGSPLCTACEAGFEPNEDKSLCIPCPSALLAGMQGPAPLSAIHAGKVPFQNRERVAVRCALDRSMHSLVMRFAESVLSHQ